MTRKGLINKQIILADAINDALSRFGVSAHKTILWYLHSRGLYIGREDFDLCEFSEALEDLIGSGGDALLNEVFSSLQKRLISATILATLDLKSCPDCPLERIERLLQIGENH